MVFTECVPYISKTSKNYYMLINKPIKIPNLSYIYSSIKLKNAVFKNVLNKLVREVP